MEFKRGDKVVTAQGKRGTVASTGREGGRARIYVRTEPYGEEKGYYPTSLRRAS
jgi:hypothetical protein